MKNCPFCHKFTIKKNAHQNNVQRYKCLQCNKTFTLKSKLNPIQI
ncbi:IS1/IS1595 family N-terminal zinc-binding domain-containing protein [Glaesserella australis]